MAVKRKVKCGIACLVIGILISVAGILLFVLGERTLQKAIQNQLVIDEPKEGKEQYDHWLTNDYEDAPPLYKAFSLWNLTNVEQVLNGEKPRYTAVGPYYYRKYRTKMDVEFPDDGNQVRYKEYDPYFFDSAKSGEGKDPTVDKIINIDPIYVGIISATGGEKNLLTFMQPTVLKQFTGLLNTLYVQIVLDNYFPNLLVPLQQSLVGEINKTVNDTQEAEQIFYNTWANATKDPTYPGFNATMRVSEGNVSSDITLKSALGLFSRELNVSLTNNGTLAVMTWLGAENNNPDAQAALIHTFGLSLTQLELLIKWRSRLNTQVFAPVVAQLKGLTSPGDIGYAQWGMGDITPVSLAQMNIPGVNLPITPEFAFWAQKKGYTERFNVTTSKKLLTGQYALTELNNTLFFLQTLSTNTTNSTNTLLAVWGVTRDEAMKISLYMYDCAFAVVNQTFTEGSGLFVTKTIHEWLWYSVDPLKQLLTPDAPYANLFTNDTSKEFAQQRNASTFYTGKDDIKQINEYIDYEGVDEISIWEQKIKISGTDGTQFSPREKKETLYAWVPELMRPVELDYEKGVTLHKIPLQRHRIAQQALEANPLYFQTIPGFANMTSNNQGAPIFLSKPNFLDVPQEWRDKIEGMDPQPEKDDTHLDVEPLTGITMSSHKRLQVNVYITSATASLFNVFPHQNFTRDLFYPIVAVDENGEISKHDADEFRDRVLKPIYYFFVFFLVGVVLGGVIVVIGFIVLIKGALQARDREDYHRF